MPREILELREEEDCLISIDDLDRTSARSIYDLYNGKVSISEPTFASPDNYTLRSKGYIGHLPINNDFLIKISPKVPVSNIFGMLEYAYNLESFKIFEDQTGVASVDDIFEKLASILAKRVLTRVRKGLYRDYIEKEGALNYLRGRCLLLKSFRNSMRGAVRLECEYEENTADLDENRILAWTLYNIPRMQLNRDDVRREVKRAYRALAGAVSVSRIEPRDCISRFYNRLNDDYRPMHGLCRFFLEHCGPGIELGGRDFIPFLLYMPNLFQSFVANWMNVNLPAGLRVVAQYSTNFDDTGRFSFDIDLVLIEVGTERVLAVLDTKYKRPDKPGNADISQVVTYALHMNTQNAFLVYPSHQTESVNVSIGSDYKVNVRSIVFDISHDIEAAGRQMIDELLGHISYYH